MSVRKNLLAEITKKANKILDRRAQAAVEKTIETVVFQFFKNIEEARFVGNGEYYETNIFAFARDSLEKQVKSFDRGAKVSIEFNATNDPNVPWNNETVRGVTIWWSAAHIKKNNVHPSYYIDVSQMLFL